jgi:ribonuclease HI
MSKKKKKEVVLTPVDKELVIYTDGGSRFGGCGGWGVHGYVYSNEKPSTGSGLAKFKLTSKGYIKDEDLKDNTEVKPHNYIDGYGSFSELTTNNMAELHAATEALNIADKLDVKSVKLYTDSNMVVQGINEWMDKWKKNDYKRSDNTEIKNKERWIDLDNAYQNLKNKNIDVNISWIESHSGHVGNELSDKYATIGVMNSFHKNLQRTVNELPAKGYWKKVIERHPLMINKFLYFNSDISLNTPGEYYLGDHGKEDDLIGANKTDNSICFMMLKKPDTIIELVKQKQYRECENVPSMCYIALMELFKPNIGVDVDKYGEMCLFRENEDGSKNLKYLDTDILITKNFHPPKRVYFLAEQLNHLKSILVGYLDNKPIYNFQVNDVTEYFFTKDDKGILSLNKDISVGKENIEVKVSYDIEKQYNLKLFFRVDVPDRNVFKRIETLNPKIKTLTWLESTNTFRYVTTIEIEDGIAIYSGYNSNLKIIK